MKVNPRAHAAAREGWRAGQMARKYDRTLEGFVNVPFSGDGFGKSRQAAIEAFHLGWWGGFLGTREQQDAAGDSNPSE